MVKSHLLYAVELGTRDYDVVMAEHNYKIVLSDEKTLDVVADRYSTTDKEDMFVFYNEDNEPVAEFQRWNIQGLYIDQ